MTHVLETIVINGENLTAYSSVANAVTRITGKFGDSATTWLALSADNQGRTLVTASDIFDQFLWDGSQTVASQARAFPRSSLTDREGETLSSTFIPDDMVNGTIELALLISGNEELISNPGGGSLNKKLKAGSAEIEFFRPSADTAGILPKNILDLIGLYLKGGDVQLAITGGTSNKSTLETNYCLTEGL